MQIPKKLKVSGHLILVKFKHLEDDYGYWDMELNTIFIHDKLPQSQKEATFFHELLHVLNAPMGDSDYGHALLDSLGLQLYQVFKDNNLMAKASTKVATKKGKVPSAKAKVPARKVMGGVSSKGKKVTVKK